MPTAVIFIFTLILFRCGGIIFALPVFGEQATPVRVKILLSFGLALFFYPQIWETWQTPIPNDIISLSILVIKELIIGLVFGLVGRLFFAGILLAASIVGFQMGFGTANLIVPDAGEQMNGFTAFHRILTVLIFLTLDLHHIFLIGCKKTFDLIPPGGFELSPYFAHYLIGVSSDVFEIGLQLSAPVLVALLFTMAALGLIARTVPQMNVFTLSFPASFFVGLLIYIATIPFLPAWIKIQGEDSQSHYFAAVKGMAP